MKVVFPHRVHVRLSPHSDQLVDVLPGQPVEMPDEEALARIAAGNVAPYVDAGAKKKQAGPEGLVLEQKPEGIQLERKSSAKASDPAPEASA